jgi:hypothetical protein
VTTAFTDLFDIVKEAAPTRVNIDKTFTAGKILMRELERIRAITFWTPERVQNTIVDFNNGAIPRTDSLNKHNAEVEKKKEAQRVQELGDLTQALKLSIEKAEKNRQEG